jgi:hypothetical protein
MNKKSRKVFAEIMEDLETVPLSDGHICQIISIMTTERTTKSKKSKLYKHKHKNNEQENQW